MMNQEDVSSLRRIKYTGKTCRISGDYDDESMDMILADIDAFCQSPKCKEVTDLLIGMWSEPFDISCELVIEKLVEKKDQLQHLELLYIGDMEYDECEISWILQSDLNALFAAYPNLKHLKVKGGTDLTLGEIKHDNLMSLSIYTGGMPRKVLHQLAQANLPKLTDLTLWLGTEDYGFDGSINDVVPLLKPNLFPSLINLGLQNSDIADEIAKALSKNPLQESIKSLNFSMGVLSDEGAELLLANDRLNQLDVLNVDNNFLSKDMVSRVRSGFKINTIIANEQREDDGYGRYVEVGE